MGIAIIDAIGNPGGFAGRRAADWIEERVGNVTGDLGLVAALRGLYDIVIPTTVISVSVTLAVASSEQRTEPTGVIAR